jgi:hypothetical protein
MYPFCLQIDLKSDGLTVPKETYKFPDIYTKHDQTFMNFQTKAGVDELTPSDDKPFKFPGPPLYSGGGDGGSSGTGSGGNNGVGSGSDSGVSASSLTNAGSSGTGVASDKSGSAQTTASPPQPTAIIAAQESSVSTGAYTAETTAASPSPSLDVNLSNKQVDHPSNQDGADNPETVEKTLPSANSGNQQGPAASASTGNTMSGSGVTTAISPAGTAEASTSNKSGNSDYVSDVAGGNCQEGAWRCGTKDGKTIMERCQRIDQTQYGMFLRFTLAAT